MGDVQIHGEGQDSARSTGNTAHAGPFTCCQPVPALASSFSAHPRPTYCFMPGLSTPLGQFYADEGLVCLSPHPDLCLRPQTCTPHLSPCWWGPHPSVSAADSSPSPVNQCLFPQPVTVLLNLLWQCPCSPAPRSSRPEWEPNAAVWPRCNPKRVTSSLRAGFQTSKIEAHSRSKHWSLDGAARDLKPILRLGNPPPCESGKRKADIPLQQPGGWTVTALPASAQ